MIREHALNSNAWSLTNYWETRILSIDEIPMYQQCLDGQIERLRMEINNAVKFLPPAVYKARCPADLPFECGAQYYFEPLPEHLRPLPTVARDDLVINGTHTPNSVRHGQVYSLSAVGMGYG